MAIRVTFPNPVKDPRDSVRYYFDWSEWLIETEDHITGVVVTSNAAEVESDDVETPLVLGTPDHTGTAVEVRVSGGEVGKTYLVTCEITTDQGDTVNRAAKISVKDV